MVVSSFSFHTCSKVLFGAGQSRQLPDLARQFGSNILLVAGASSLEKSGYMAFFLEKCKSLGASCDIVKVAKEPTPEFVDEICEKFRQSPPNVVVGIGGGSVLDAAKAISAMIRQKDSVIHYLEGIGKKQYNGNKIPMIAVPTTAGTGSEVTKNAVLGREGCQGFKSSLRHDSLIPNIALVDPELMLSCPASITAACGLDAFTQLLESYVSTKANILTDALALSGIEQCKDNLLAVAAQKSQDIPARTAMAYAALLSGITLANAGLGVVHGFASCMGGIYGIPHGLLCGILLPAATRINIEALERIKNLEFLEKYAKVAQILSSDRNSKAQDLSKILLAWNDSLQLPKLEEVSIGKIDVEQVVESVGQKNNPVLLTKEEPKAILM